MFCIVQIIQSRKMQVNGENIALEKPMDLMRFLALSGFDEKLVAVERNGDIVPRGSFAAVELDDGDVLEILHFVGGG
jgi:thiamine biosynthesis protein ThiS